LYDKDKIKRIESKRHERKINFIISFYCKVISFGPSMRHIC